MTLRARGRPGVDAPATPADFALAATEALDVGVLLARVPDLVLYANRAAREALNLGARPALPRELADLARDCAPGASARIELPQGKILYVQVQLPTGRPDCRVLLVRPHVLREPDLLRHLEINYGVTRREFQALKSLRLGRTNRQIGEDLGISENGAARLVKSLLSRFDAPNRTALVRMVEAIASRSRL